VVTAGAHDLLPDGLRRHSETGARQLLILALNPTGSARARCDTSFRTVIRGKRSTPWWEADVAR
jgi:hypothetical protein